MSLLQWVWTATDRSERGCLCTVQIVGSHLCLHSQHYCMLGVHWDRGATGQTKLSKKKVNFNALTVSGLASLQLSSLCGRRTWPAVGEWAALSTAHVLPTLGIGYMHVCVWGGGRGTVQAGCPDKQCTMHTLRGTQQHNTMSSFVGEGRQNVTVQFSSLANTDTALDGSFMHCSKFQ